MAVCGHECMAAKRPLRGQSARRRIRGWAGSQLEAVSGGATGAGDGQCCQERAMPKPQLHQARWASGVSVPPSHAHHGLVRLLTVLSESMLPGCDSDVD